MIRQALSLADIAKPYPNQVSLARLGLAAFTALSSDTNLNCPKITFSDYHIFLDNSAFLAFFCKTLQFLINFVEFFLFSFYND